ncbi:MAG: histidine kinase [Bacteroidota bacterium]
MEKKKITNISIHIVVWAIYILLPSVILPEPSEFLLNNNLQLIIYITLTVLSIAFFYFNYNYALPKLYFQKKHLNYILVVFVFLTVTGFITGYIAYSFDPTYSMQYRQSGILRNYFLRFAIIFVASLVFGYRKRYRQIEEEKVKAELSTLKAQINPHFLFNTLNGIYAQAITKSENTANSISKLSSLMRYALTETIAEKVSLEKELNYINNYIELQKIRLTGKTKVIFRVDGNTNAKQIAPMLLISFVENAFKYGVSNEIETQIKISVLFENGDLIFRVFNDKVPNTAKENSSNLGIKNTKNRLELTYPDSYTLNITDNDKTFEVKLKIKNL